MPSTRLLPEEREAIEGIKVKISVKIARAGPDEPVLGVAVVERTKLSKSLLEFPAMCGEALKAMPAAAHSTPSVHASASSS